MSPSLTELERNLVDAWLRQGHYARVVRYVELRSNALPKLYLYRTGIRAAAMLHDFGALERFADAAREHFPDSATGFVEGARLLLRQQRTNDARRLLQTTPRQKKPDAEVLRAEHDIQESLGTLKDLTGAQLEGAQLTALDELRRAYSEAARGNLWHEARRLADKAVARYPDVAFGHLALANVLNRNGQAKAARRVLESLPWTSPIERDLQLCEMHRDAGDDAGALRVLTLAQRHHTGDRRLLMRMADLLRDDRQIDRAHSYLQLAERIYPEYGAVRLLSFESDVGWWESGAATLAKVLEFEPAVLMKFMSIVNRVAVFYPECRTQLEQARGAVRAELWRGVLTSSDTFESALRTALNNRWLSDLDDLLDLGNREGLSPSEETRDRIQKVHGGLGVLKDLVEIAWRNEHEEQLIALSASGTTRLSEEEQSSDRTVELFVPTPFFAYDDTEKPTYETVRSIFRSVASVLLARDDLRVVPRLQLNWRHAVPRTSARVVSYHTHGVRDARRLHIQEAPFSGFCSFDDQGFAGYASLADDFGQIDAGTQHVAAETLEETLRALHERYVVKNVSKYVQSSEDVAIEGRYVFVPLQVTTDIVADLAWLDGMTMLRTVVAAYAGSEVKVVVKRHPYCHSIGVQRAIAALEAAGQILVSSASVHTLLANAEAVYTVNSGVGLEALLHMRPVVVTGKSDYLYAVTPARTVEELRDVIASRPRLDRTRALRFLHFYSHEYLVDPSDAAAVQRSVRRWLARALT